MWICCMSQKTQIGALYQPRVVGCGGKWEGGSEGWGHIYIYIPMADSCWDLTEKTKFCKAIILQLKKNKLIKKIKKKNVWDSFISPYILD